MSNDNTGGTAFPCHTIAMHEGMTLRDYFAAKSMQADISRVGYYGRDDLVERQAVMAYKMADAMLKARKS